MDIKNTYTEASNDSLNLTLRESAPKVIWFFWAQGIKEDTPEVVRLFLESWRRFNPDYEVIVLTNQNVRTYCPLMTILDSCDINFRMATKSDFLRTYLLAMHGGIWVDATTFCLKPLSLWLDNAILQTGFFFFLQPKDVVDRQIKSWFIASYKQHPLLLKLLHNLSKYFFKPRKEKLELLPLHLNPNKFSEYSECVGRESTGYLFLDKLEQEGVFPFFCFFYIVNETVNEEGFIDIWSQLSVNNIANTNALDFVSKQSHQPRWMERNRNLFNARKRTLILAMNEYDENTEG